MPLTLSCLTFCSAWIWSEIDEQSSMSFVDDSQMDNDIKNAILPVHSFGFQTCLEV